MNERTYQLLVELVRAGAIATWHNGLLTIRGFQRRTP